MKLLRLQMTNLCLWARIAAGMGLGFMLLFVAFSLLGERALGNSNERILQERLIVAQMAAGQFDMLLDSHLKALSLIQQSVHFDPSLADPPAVQRALAEAISQMDGRWTALFLCDAAGQMVLAQPSELFPFRRKLPRLWGVEQSAGVFPVFHAIRDPRDDQPVLAVTVPFVQAGRLLGTLSALIRLDHASFAGPLAHAVTASRSSHADLVDGQGRRLVSAHPVPFLSAGVHATFYRRAIAQDQAVVDLAPVEAGEAGDKEGLIHAMAVAPLRQVAWAVAMGEEASETFAGVQWLRRELALLALLTLSVVLAASLVGARRLVRPVQRLTLSAQRIAAGDLQTPLQVVEGGEIGDMALALERMRSQLLANISQLADLNENLEGHVAERTLALQQQQALTHQLLRQVISAQEEERGRLSQELHDEIGQTLTAVQISLDLVGRALPADQLAARERVGRARFLSEQALDDLRRVISALRPGVLDRLGLAPALGWLAEHHVRPLGMECTIVTARQESRLPGEIETVLFRIAQEAMNNVVRHSQATQMGVSLLRRNGHVAMTVWDDGCGFESDAVDDLNEIGRGLGLAGMEERASLAGGRLHIESVPGHGTQVHTEIPLPGMTGLHEPDTGQMERSHV